MTQQSQPSFASVPLPFGDSAAVVAWQRAPVGSLLLGSCPSTVLWAVRAVVVDPINGMIGRWFRPHVGEEAGEVQPARVDGDAAPAVAFPGRVIGVGAAPLESRPHAIQRMLVAITRVAVRAVPRPLEAAAALSAARAQVPSSGNMDTPARAQTLPARLPRHIRRALDNGEAPIDAAGNIDEFPHSLQSLQPVIAGQNLGGVHSVARFAAL